MNIKISREANNDIEQIWLYTVNNWSKEQADRYYNIIFDEIEYLANYPDSGKNYGNLVNGYFGARVKSHIIFYKINAKESEIQIIRVLHNRMDIETRLNE